MPQFAVREIKLPQTLWGEHKRAQQVRWQDQQARRKDEQNDQQDQQLRAREGISKIINSEISTWRTIEGRTGKDQRVDARTSGKKLLMFWNHPKA